MDLFAFRSKHLDQRRRISECFWRSFEWYFEWSTTQHRSILSCSRKKERVAYSWTLSSFAGFMLSSLRNVAHFRFGPNFLMTSMLGAKRVKIARVWVHSPVMCTLLKKIESFETKDCPQTKEIVAH